MSCLKNLEVKFVTVVNAEYSTNLGSMYQMALEDFLDFETDNLRGKVNLILTSPPFPLNRKKKYGNLNGEAYINWLTEISKRLTSLLTDDGSIVIEIGNSWESGFPVFSTLPIEALLEFKKASNLYLCQEFIVFNPSRLPSPIEWVNKKRIRVKDSFTRVWWLSKTPFPKANNKNVLVEYSSSMKKLLKVKKYNSGKRPSEHVIGEKSFFTNNNGAIAPNVLTLSNTNSNDKYIKYCKKHSLLLHPARMPRELPDFFIKFLTNEGDLVLDPFAGSNTTGEIAQLLSRKWLSVEVNEVYVEGSKGRFILEPAIKKSR